MAAAACGSALAREERPVPGHFCSTARCRLWERARARRAPGPDPLLQHDRCRLWERARARRASDPAHSRGMTRCRCEHARAMASATGIVATAWTAFPLQERACMRPRLGQTRRMEA